MAIPANYRRRVTAMVLCAVVGIAACATTAADVPVAWCHPESAGSIFIVKTERGCLAYMCPSYWTEERGWRAGILDAGDEVCEVPWSQLPRELGLSGPEK